MSPSALELPESPSRPRSDETPPGVPRAPLEPPRPALEAARSSSRHLADLLRRDHEGLAEFLIALADFDRRGLWRELGHRDLFSYLHHELQLSNSAAHYRKVAAGLIQRFPEVVAPLRDGRLCLSAVGDLARVVTRENWETVLPRFFYRGRRQAREVSVEVRPAEVIPRRDVVAPVQGGEPEPGSSPFRPGETGMTHPPEGGMGVATLDVATRSGDAAGSPANSDAQGAAPGVPAGPNLDTLTEPLTADLYRLHVTLTKRVIRKLEKARAGISHAVPRAGFADAIEAALDLLLEQQARRRGITARPQANPRSSHPLHVPAAVRRAVWERDQGRCRWPLDSGGQCGSTWQVEVDHVVPRALGGPSTVENCRLLCRSHNDLAARLVYGNDWMDQFTAGIGG